MIMGLWRNLVAAQRSERCGRNGRAGSTPVSPTNPRNRLISGGTLIPTLLRAKRWARQSWYVV